MFDIRILGLGNSTAISDNVQVKCNWSQSKIIIKHDLQTFL